MSLEKFLWDTLRMLRDLVNDIVLFLSIIFERLRRLGNISMTIKRQMLYPYTQNTEKVGRNFWRVNFISVPGEII